MIRTTALAVLLGMFALGTGFLIGGRYAVVTIPGGTAAGGLIYVVDRLTGGVSTCDRSGCAQVH